MVTAGSVSLSREEFIALWEGLPEQAKAQFSGPGGQKRFAEQVGEILALSAEARAMKLDEQAKVAAQIKLQTAQVLAQNVVGKAVEAGDSEAELKKAYEANSAQYDTVAARHILIRFKGSQVPLKEGQKDLSEAEALAKLQDIRKRVGAGEDFAALAKSESDDTGSGAQGGSLGEFGRGQMVKAFEDAAFALADNAMSEPVRTQFGFHLIQTQAHKRKSFDEVKGQLQQRSRQGRVQSVVDEIKKKNPVTINEALLDKAQ